MKRSSKMVNCQPPMIMKDDPTKMLIVLLFIVIIFYVFQYAILNNTYKFVIFDGLNNVEYEFLNENQNGNCEMLTENDYHGLLCLIPIRTHISPSPTIEFISISDGIPRNNDLRWESGFIQEENNIGYKILSGM